LTSRVSETSWPWPRDIVFRNYIDSYCIRLIRYGFGSLCCLRVDALAHSNNVQASLKNVHVWLVLLCTIIIKNLYCIVRVHMNIILLEQYYSILYLYYKYYVICYYLNIRFFFGHLKKKNIFCIWPNPPHFHIKQNYCIKGRYFIKIKCVI